MIWLITIAIYAVASISLARHFGPAVGLMLFIVATSLLTCLAGWLLQTAAIDSVTWKNQAAGLFLPWGAFVGRSELIPLLIKNELVSIAFGVLVVIAQQFYSVDGRTAERPLASSETASLASTTVYWLTLVCWFVILAAWFYFLRSFSAHSLGMTAALKQNRELWIPLLAPPVLLGTSITCRASNLPWVALLIVGIPLLIILVPALLMASYILIQYLIGKPIRWN